MSQSAERCSMYVVDQSKQELWSLVALGMNDRFTVPMGKGIAGTCAQQASVMNIIDAQQDPRTMQSVSRSSFVMRNTLCVPIFVKRAGGSTELAAEVSTLMKSKSMSTARSMRRLSDPEGDRGSEASSEVIGVIQLLNSHSAAGHFTTEDEEGLEAFCDIVGLAMQNAKTYDDMKAREETTSRILTSISPYILQITNDGMLAWCNREDELVRIFGTSVDVMSFTHFSEWLSCAVSDTDRLSSPQPELARRVADCLSTGKRSSSTSTNVHGQVTQASVRVDAKGHEAGDSFAHFFTYGLTPMLHRNPIDERAPEVQVGALLVLEDVSEARRRQQAEEKLHSAFERMSLMESQLSALSISSAQVSETPLQRAIEVVRGLQLEQPELQATLQEVLNNLLSRDIMAPTLLNDKSKMNKMDQFTRDYLDGATGLLADAKQDSAGKRLKKGVKDGRTTPGTPTQGSRPGSFRVGSAALAVGEPLSSPAAPARWGFSKFFRHGKRSATVADAAASGAASGSDVHEGVACSSTSASSAAIPMHIPLMRRSSFSVGGMAAREDGQPASRLRRSSLSSIKDRRSSLSYIRGSTEATGELDVEALRLRIPPRLWITPSELKADLQSWELDLYSCHGAEVGATEAELFALALELFKSVHIEATLGVPESTIQNFVLAVCKGYLPQPFHNFSHGVYVLQGCVVMLQRCQQLRDLLRPIDQLALCIAALGHDIGHMGVQNTFLVNTNDPLALLYNDKSVLESMHASKLFRVLQTRGCGLFAGMSTTEFREVRKLMIGAILATDLSNHFADMTKFSTRMDNVDNEPWSGETAADRQMAVDIVLHAADLAGPARPWHVSSVWSGKVQQEFVAQVEMEREQGVPVSSFLLAPKPKLEMGFIKVFALPVWQSLSKFLPELEDRVEDVNANHTRWERELSEMEPQVQVLRP